MIGLLSMCEVMGLHMHIALVDLYWAHELGIIMLYVMWSCSYMNYVGHNDYLMKVLLDMN